MEKNLLGQDAYLMITTSIYELLLVKGTIERVVTIEEFDKMEQTFQIMVPHYGQYFMNKHYKNPEELTTDILTKYYISESNDYAANKSLSGDEQFGEF